MLVYSVTVALDDRIEQEWVSWMKEVHIPDVMKTGKFMEYRFCKVLPMEDAQLSYNIQYLCANQQELDDYQKNHAPALQEDHTRKFQGKFGAFRTILEVIE